MNLKLKSILVSSLLMVSFSGSVLADPTNTGGVSGSGSSSTNTVPEPSILALLGLGVVGLVVVRRRK